MTSHWCNFLLPPASFSLTLYSMGKSSKKRRPRTPGKSKKKESETKPAVKKRQLAIPPALKFVLSFLLSLAVLGLAYSHLTARYHDNLLWLMDVTATA